MDRVLELEEVFGTSEPDDIIDQICAENEHGEQAERASDTTHTI